jgi:hypothetical protein
MSVVFLVCVANQCCSRKCFEFVLENLDQCRQDDSLITSRLLSPASAHLSTILELLWEIQRKESLVQLLARGLDRHQSKTISTSSTSLPLSEKPNSTRNDTELERRIQVGKLSIMWMRLVSHLHLHLFIFISYLLAERLFRDSIVCSRCLPTLQ